MVPRKSYDFFVGSLLYDMCFTNLSPLKGFNRERGLDELDELRQELIVAYVCPEHYDFISTFNGTETTIQKIRETSDELQNEPEEGTVYTRMESRALSEIWRIIKESSLEHKKYLELVPDNEERKKDLVEIMSYDPVKLSITRRTVPRILKGLVHRGRRLLRINSENFSAKDLSEDYKYIGDKIEDLEQRLEVVTGFLEEDEEHNEDSERPININQQFRNYSSRIYQITCSRIALWAIKTNLEERYQSAMDKQKNVSDNLEEGKNDKGDSDINAEYFESMDKQKRLLRSYDHILRINQNRFYMALTKTSVLKMSHQLVQHNLSSTLDFLFSIYNLSEYTYCDRMLDILRKSEHNTRYRHGKILRSFGQKEFSSKFPRKPLGQLPDGNILCIPALYDFRDLLRFNPREYIVDPGENLKNFMMFQEYTE